MRLTAFHGLLLPLLLAAFVTTSGASEAVRLPAWGNAPGVDPCGSQTLLERQLAQDPELRKRREMYETLLAEALRKGLVPESSKPGGPQALVASPTYVIPVAVHIVHSGVPVGTAENLSDQQVLSQIAALNRDCQNLPPLPATANAKIKFCLAQNLPPASPVVWSTMPGITRDNSPETNHTYGSLASETALKAISYLPADRYLNIWVVKTIAGGSGGVAGYGTYPGANPLSRDGIVMRYDVFGSNTTGYGTFSLLPSNNDGKILSHEVGHYLNLYHPFQGGCTPPGDFVSDTPPEAVNGSGCPGVPPTSCTAAPDPIENYMDYTNDACRYAFTPGQISRMYAAIGTYRSLLVSAANLVYTGCPSGLNALILANPSQVCAGGTVAFTTPASGPGYTYNWQFPGGAPASATTQSVNVTYASAGTVTATLTVTDTTNGNFSTNAQTIYVIACSSILSHCTNWVFSSGCQLSFATGVPVAVGGRQNGFGEAAGQMSDASGNLLFYTNAGVVWDKNNNVMPNGSGLQSGISSHNGALAVPRPGSATQYFLFIIAQNEDGFVPNPATYNVIDMTLNGGNGDIVSGQKNLPINLLPAGNKRIMEGQTLIPHCNGVDWWLIQHGGETTSGKIWVTLVTSAGPVSTTTYNIGVNCQNSPGAITASNDGSRFAVICFYPSQLAVYNFNRSTGVPTVLLPATATGNPYIDACFSPDGKLLYFTTWDYASTYGVKQLEIATAQQRDVVTNVRGDVELGPDGRVYLGQAGSPTIHVVNNPNAFNTANANECQLNLNAISLSPGADGVFGALPNTLAQCSNGAQPAAFTYTVQNCTNVTFTAANCSGPYNWNFGDASPNGSGQTVSHTYAVPGVYNVTLTVTGASPPSVMQTLTLQVSGFAIAGPAPTCSNPSNYSAAGPANYTYSWTITGGSPATATGNNVDVNWNPGGGTVVLTATDPATGCSGSVSKAVGYCPTCVRPPLGMAAWYPLDEASGTVAQEIVAGNDGTDINAPGHVPGKVSRGRSFSFNIHNYIRVNDHARLNFGTGDFTIDAWIQTTSLEDLPIVDKRTFSPERGYFLFLRQGKLGLRIGDGVTGTDYLANTPLVNDGAWHHVAAVEKRSAGPNGTRLFIDGVPAAAFPAIPAAVNLTNTEKMLIGGMLPTALSPAFFFEGKLDEIELFNRALTPAEIAGMAAADSLGKCKEYGTLPWSVNICGLDYVIVPLTICNYSSAPATYNVSMGGLPSGTPGIGAGCTTAGPSSFTFLTAPPYTVPANSCLTVQVKVFKPAGMPSNSSACYGASITNMTSGYTFACKGSVSQAKFCGVVIGPPVLAAGPGTPASLKFRVKNGNSAPVDGPYSVQAIPFYDDEARALSLNGLPPGEPYLGTLSVASGDSADVDVSASFTAEQPFRFYDVVFGMDSDGDGVSDSYASATVRYVDHDVPPTGVGDEGDRVARPMGLLPVAPNPIRSSAIAEFDLPSRSAVRLALYDVSGRRVRTIAEGVREAGRQSVRVDVTGLKIGVYFLKLDAAGTSAVRRVAVIR